MSEEWTYENDEAKSFETMSYDEQQVVLKRDNIFIIKSRPDGDHVIMEMAIEDSFKEKLLSMSDLIDENKTEEENLSHIVTTALSAVVDMKVEDDNAEKE